MFLFSAGAIERHGNLEAALDALLMDPPVTWNPIAAKKERFVYIDIDGAIRLINSLK